MIAEQTTAAADEAEPGTRVPRVAWIGEVPPWLRDQGAAEELFGVSLEFAPRLAGPFAPKGQIDVLHVTGEVAGELETARSAFGSAAIILDLGDEVEQTEVTRAAIAAADVVLVGSEAAGRAVTSISVAASQKLRVQPSPLDLTWCAPASDLLKTRGAPLKRFQRFHRIGPPVMLFVGPYTQEGGLDLAIEATFRLREELEDVRLAAIPLGAFDQKWLDTCEMRALGLGHRGIIEWETAADEIPFWYAIATVVVTLSQAVGTSAPARLAAAAGRPYVTAAPASVGGTDAPAADFVVPSGDLDALVDALRPLLTDRDEADRLGVAARARAEKEFSPAGVANALATLWAGTAKA